MMFTPINLEQIDGKRVLRTVLVSGGFLILFDDNTYLSCTAHQEWEDTCAISTQPVNYTNPVKRQLGLVP